MKITNINGINCIYLDDIEEELGIDAWNQFYEWFAGQTGFVHKTRLMVFETDYRRFILNGWEAKNE